MKKDDKKAELAKETKETKKNEVEKFDFSKMKKNSDMKEFE